jgi:NAD(P)-dependent dehydrogenase (short-subunit alcohol dehydrogenase family)
VNLFDMSGDVVVITGGTGAIGRSFSKVLIDAGATVVIWGRGRTVAVSEAVRRIAEDTGQPGRIHGFEVDVADKAAVEEGLARVRSELAMPTTLINAAGGNKGKAPFVEADLDLFREVVEMNLIGGLVVPTQVFAKAWIEAGVPGSIVNIASMAAHTPLSGVWAYGASKAAVVNLTQGCAKEFAQYQIRVNAISPGFFVGAQNRDLLYDDFAAGRLSARGEQIISRTPYGRFGEEEDLFGPVLFLCSREASGFVTGVCLPVDGGYLIDNI